MKQQHPSPSLPPHFKGFGGKLPRPGVMPDPSEMPLEHLPRPALRAVAFAMTGRLSNLFPRWLSENIESDWGITGPGLLLIGLITRTRDMTMTSAAEALDLTPGAITRIVKDLEKAELVVRFENPQDRRQSFIRLTPAARKKAKNLMPLHDGLIARTTNDLTDDELRAYLKVAFKLSEAFRSRPEISEP